MARQLFEMGRYWGKITHQRLGKTSNANPQLVLSFLVIGKIDPASPEGELLPIPYQAEKQVYRVITDNTIDYVTQDLDRLGWYGESWQQFDEETPGFSSLIGNELEFFCKHEPHYQTGDPREIWSIAMAAGAQVTPLSDAESRKLDALFGKALKGRQAKAPKAPAAEPPPPDGPVATEPATVLPAVAAGTELEVPADDDIPFIHAWIMLGLSGLAGWVCLLA